MGGTGRSRGHDLDALVERHGRPAFVKIDVEGYEPEVLTGLSVRPDALSFEFSLDRLDAVETCVGRIDALGRAQLNHSWGREHRLDPSAWVDGASLVGRLRSVAGGTGHGGGDVFARWT